MVMGQGSWTLRSKSDPRWNCSGQGEVGMFSIPRNAKKKVEKLKVEFGEAPPNDLEYSYMKD